MSTESAAVAGTVDRGAAVTRSLLGWGVVAGPFYLVVGLVQAFTVPGFEISRHALSALMLGPFGWIQAVNLILTGLMVGAAAIGFVRVMPRPTTGILLGIYGLCLLGSAVFPPDATGGFPVGSPETGTASTSGLLHLVFGAIGFLCLAVAAIVAGRWFRSLDRRGLATVSWIAGIIVILGFFGGAALSQGPAGVALLWVAVVSGFAWLLVASLAAYRIAPDPDCA